MGPPTRGLLGLGAGIRCNFHLVKKEQHFEVKDLGRGETSVDE